MHASIWSLLGGTFRGLGSGWGGRGPRRKKPKAPWHRPRSLQAEPLEKRELLAITWQCWVNPLWAGASGAVTVPREETAPGNPGTLTIGTNAFGTIKDAVAAAANHAPTGSNTVAIYVMPGTYAEDPITISTPNVQLLGPNAGTAANTTNTRVAEAVVTSKSDPGSGGYLLTIEAPGVVVNGLTLNGYNPGSTSTAVALTNGGSSTTADAVCVTSDGTSVPSNVQIVDCRIVDFYQRAIYWSGAVDNSGIPTTPATTGGLVDSTLIENIGTVGIGWSAGVLALRQLRARSPIAT